MYEDPRIFFFRPGQLLSYHLCISENLLTYKEVEVDI